MVLKTVYGLDDPMDPAPAIALNGGIGYSGGMCGSLTGAALAVGMLAERRLDDHARAKVIARELVADTLETFRDGARRSWTAATSSATTCGPPAATRRSSPAASGAAAAWGRSRRSSGTWPASPTRCAWERAVTEIEARAGH